MKTVHLYDQDWFTFARLYETAEAASADFERLDRVGKRNKGKLELGVYRLLRREHGAPRVIACVSIKRHGIDVAEKLLGGEDYYGISEKEWQALILRRARVVVSLEGAEPGSYKIRRPVGRPLRLRPDGTGEEPLGHD